MVTCGTCGHDNPADASFCNACGSPLGALSKREERKIVSVLFADLVGFTSRSESLDPEDVRALLTPYWEHLRNELERYGGTVEKFIGDAVMALFGAPVAHEDDPERAVRAALAIRDWVRMSGEDLQVRIAVNTGEVLVLLGARPAQGEGMAAGDVVNTASRLQSAAPVNGVIVGEATFHATRDRIDYRAAEPVLAKGKTKPLPVWEALGARSRATVETPSAAPLVGRAQELDLLIGALERTRSEAKPQLVTIVGVPGIGKSRLVTELFAAADIQPDWITWRSGRSLPYGEGVSFWALGEIAKAETGVLESDSNADAEAKLAASLERLLEDEAERTWLSDHLRPLLGLASVAPRAQDQSEKFSAWRRFLEAIALVRPTVLVFEDMHWADDDLVDFVDELADWLVDVPLLVVCTTRPELLERRPGWGGGKPNALTVSLGPLSDAETARVVAATLDRTPLSAELHEALLERAAGNPLYAEQYARAIAEGSGGLSDLPDTVHGLIAARLDLLPAAEKSLLQDAAVLGRTFWPEAIAAIAEEESGAIEVLLRALGRKEFVRRDRRSSVAGETEYAFAHALVRDVAYQQIPRVLRAEKHVRAAAWIEALSPDRTGDRADLLAHHYRAAIDLRAAAGLDTADLVERARAACFEAGARAASLNANKSAVRHYTAALDLMDLLPHEAGDREEVLLAREEAAAGVLAGGETAPDRDPRR
jgi:class 3 adenylate cyclase